MMESKNHSNQKKRKFLASTR